MALRTEDTEHEDEPGDDRPRPGWTRTAKRYGPFVAVVVVIGIAVALFGGGGDDGDEGGGGSATGVDAPIDNDELIASGPMTWQKAEAEGRTEDIDWGPNCDTERGTIRLPVIGAPPCVEPFTGDNGGATSAGVTADEVKVIYYQPDPTTDPAGSALLSATGADVNPDTAFQAVENYAALYNEVFETYGRHVTVERYMATGPGDDVETARADAIAIAERHPFAVIGGPTQTGPAFAAELASRGIICGVDCAGSTPEQEVREYYPYIYQPGPTPDQAVALAAEMFGNLAGPGPAELAGDPATREQDRVYAVVHYDTPDGDHEPVFEAFKDQLAENGIDLETDVRFELDFSRMQDNARTIISRLKSAGVTTVIFYGDPLTPAALTEEATAQDYHPEWLLGPSVLADTTIFARQNDSEQWSHGFGMSLLPARGERSTQGAWHVYEWAYGETPPNNTVGVIDPRVRSLFTGIHLAGPDLTPETFRDGVFRNPVSGGGPTTPQVSLGDHGVWPELDLGGIDDVTAIWWDPEARGEDETGAEGAGMYRYAHGGERYTIGHLPTSIDEAGLFDEGSSETVYDRLPDEDVPPDYPPPDLPGR
jgi:ABC-type branched-subunit amino acid transport system substrate-binding protein